MNANPTLIKSQSQNERLQHRARKCRRVFRIGTLVLLIGFMVVVMLLFSAWPVGRSLFLVWLGIALAGAMSGVIAGCVWYSAIKQIAKSHDVHSLGYLLEAHATKEAVRPAIEQGLIAILPELQGTDIHLLTDRQRDYLNRLLKEDHAKLVFAILDALKVMGDSRSLLMVEKLAAGHWSARYNLPVRQAAQACLPILRERMEYEQHSKGLLRASEAPRASAEVLLRPAANKSANPDELLRVANGPTNEPQ